MHLSAIQELYLQITPTTVSQTAMRAWCWQEHPLQLYKTRWLRASGWDFLFFSSSSTLPIQSFYYFPALSNKQQSFTNNNNFLHFFNTHSTKFNTFTNNNLSK